MPCTCCLVLGVFSCVGCMVYDFSHDSGTNANEGTHINLFRRHCFCGIAVASSWNAIIFVLIAGGGFVLLWQMGVVQQSCALLLHAPSCGSCSSPSRFDRLGGSRHMLNEQAPLEEDARRAQEEEMELRRCEEEARRHEETERLAREQELRERRDLLDLFYKQHGFRGANEPRRSGCGVWAVATTYPLHCAAELADVRIAEMLLKARAILAQKNSSGKTAAQVA